jgi:hypothetical protein
VFRVERACGGSVWYAKYRLSDGRQVKKKLGAAWTERGRPPAGYFTKRRAEDWLRETLLIELDNVSGSQAVLPAFSQPGHPYMIDAAAVDDSDPGLLRRLRAPFVRFRPAVGARCCCLGEI